MTVKKVEPEPTRAAGRPKAAESIELPTEKSKVSDNLGDYSILLYGREKIGKTTLCAQFPDPLFLVFEPGAKAVSVYQLGMDSWVTFKNTIAALRAAPKRFQTIVIDTIDVAYKFCEEYVCKKLGIDHPSDEEWAKGWTMVRDELTRSLAKLAATGRGLIFLSHEADRSIKRRKGTEETRIVPSMANGARRVIEPMVDIWAYYFHDPDGHRKIRIVGDDLVSAGHRLIENFQGIEEIDAGGSPADAYQNFIAAFGNQSPVAARPKGLKAKTKIENESEN